jgi:hypothetical protein
MDALQADIHDAPPRQAAGFVEMDSNESLFGIHSISLGKEKPAER